MYGAIYGAICWLGLLLLPWRPWGTQEHIEVNGKIDTPSLDDVTVLIPARNEGLFIAHTLHCLNNQGSGLQIVVIDDQSSDDTALQAQQHNARVITGTTPPANWSGKLWALEQGFQAVNTHYTLLLDADIELAPGIIAALREKARKENLSLVSIMAKPPIENFMERLLMPAFIFFFKLLYPFGLANKQKSKVAAAAGGCILVETHALNSVNAFTSLHDALIDDCTLAARIKASGALTWIGLSHAARSHRGYQKLQPIWEMVARTAYTQLNYSPILLTFCTITMVAMFWLSPFAFLLLPSQVGFIISVIVWLIMLWTYCPVLTYYRCAPLWVALLPIIGALYLSMTWTSALRYWRGERARWKDRQYESNTH